MAWVEMGRVGSPFGVQGWVHVRSFTDPPEGLLRFRRWSMRLEGEARREHRLLEGRWQGKHLVVRLEGVADRDAAEGLRGAIIEVPRAALPPTAEREFYQTDLIGLAVVNLDGARLGVLEHFVDTPAHAVMVIRGEREHWVPAIPQHLRKVDLAGGTVLVDWPADLG